MPEPFDVYLDSRSDPDSAGNAGETFGDHRCSPWGADAGVMVTDKIQEKEVTLILAQLLQKELAKSPDIQTQLTRTSDKTISNAERMKMVKAASGEVLFISLHVNAGFGNKATGYEIFFPGFKTPATDQNESKAILKDMEQNKYLNGSVRLAQMIQRNMENVFPRKGRGSAMRRCRFLAIYPFRLLSWKLVSQRTPMTEKRS